MADGDAFQELRQQVATGQLSAADIVANCTIAAQVLQAQQEADQQQLATAQRNERLDAAAKLTHLQDQQKEEQLELGRQHARALFEFQRQQAAEKAQQRHEHKQAQLRQVDSLLSQQHQEQSDMEAQHQQAKAKLAQQENRLHRDLTPITGIRKRARQRDGQS